MEEEQERIAMIQQAAQLMQQRANEFLMADPDSQADKIMEAQQQTAPVEETELAPTE